MRLYAGFVDLKDENADTDNPDEFTGGNLAAGIWFATGGCCCSPIERGLPVGA